MVSRLKKLLFREEIWRYLKGNEKDIEKGRDRRFSEVGNKGVNDKWKDGNDEEWKVRCVRNLLKEENI